MSVVDDYLNSINEPQKTDLQRIWQIVKNELPEAEEVISYSMPAFRYKKKYLVGFFAYKNHMSLFPTPGPIEALKPKLAAFTLSKGAIQFTHENQLSDSLIKEIINHRITEIDRNS